MKNNVSLPDYLQALWQRYHALYQGRRLPKAILLVDVEGACQVFPSLVLQRLLCDAISGPCHECKHCRLFLIKEHPDLHIMSLESGTETIKVEAVRNIQASLYLPPQIAARHVVYLSSLELFTPSAINALLKIIEEPPELVYFVASTQHMERLLPTILSRFQRWILPSPFSPTSSYLDALRWQGKGEHYLALIEKSTMLLEALTDCLNEKESVVVLAEKWSHYPLKDLFHVLYCLVAEEIKKSFSLRAKTETSLPLENWQYALMLDKIESIMLQLRQCPAANPLLTLETGLLALISIASRSNSDGENSLYLR